MLTYQQGRVKTKSIRFQQTFDGHSIAFSTVIQPNIFILQIKAISIEIIKFIAT